jgi:DNA-binding transcriptional LysR family regulator
MDVRQLRYFLAVAECRNFTRAAERVHVSQPSLSVQVAALEDELGVPLFDRLGRQVELTAAGTILREHAERIIRETEQAAQLIRELTGGVHGRLIVGTVSTVNLYLIPPLVGRFKEQFPKVHLQIHAQPSSAIEADLLANRADIGICLLPVHHERFITNRLFDETLVLVAPPQFPLSAPRLRMKELADLPMVLLPNDYCLRKMIEAECAEAGVRPEVSVEMTSPEGILEAVKRGVGLTILPELYVRQRLRGTGLRMIGLYDPVPRHSVGLAYRVDRHMGKAAQAFMDLCRLALEDIHVDSESMTTNSRLLSKGSIPFRRSKDRIRAGFRP